MKLCKCGEPVAKGSKTRCKPCDAEYKWYWANKKRFGFSKEQLDNMVVEQNGCCKVCKKPFLERPRVDHCHTTNKVRGLLCHHCNTGLGHFFDNKEFLLSAIAYLE